MTADCERAATHDHSLMHTASLSVLVLTHSLMSTVSSSCQWPPCQGSVTTARMHAGACTFTSVCCWLLNVGLPLTTSSALTVSTRCALESQALTRLNPLHLQQPLLTYTCCHALCACCQLLPRRHYLCWHRTTRSRQAGAPARTQPPAS